MLEDSANDRRAFWIEHQTLAHRARCVQISDHASLGESSSFREGLALWLGLNRQANYVEIANELLDRVDSFLDEARQAFPRRVKPYKVSPSSFEG